VEPTVTTERRTCRRFAVPDATVGWRSEPAGKDYGSDARVGDLSRGGVRLLTPAPPRTGDTLKLALHVPGDPPLELLGRVVWASASSGQIHEVGVEFASYGDGAELNSQEALDGLVALERRFLSGGAR
jgi:hypothetical protein